MSKYIDEAVRNIRKEIDHYKAVASMREKERMEALTAKRLALKQARALEKEHTALLVFGKSK